MTSMTCHKTALLIYEMQILNLMVAVWFIGFDIILYFVLKQQNPGIIHLF